MQEDKKGQSSPLSRFEVYGALLEQPPHNSKQPVVKSLTKSCLFKIDLKCPASFQNCFWSSNIHLICAGQLFQPQTPGDDMMRGENHLDCLDFIFYILHLQSTPLRQFEFYTTKIICISCLRDEREWFQGVKTSQSWCTSSISCRLVIFLLDVPFWVAAQWWLGGPEKKTL